MKVFQDAANSTVRIEAGNSRGSGFHFIRPNIIVTNHHVVANGAPVQAVTEGGVVMPLRLLDSSPSNQYDYALFEVQGDVPQDRTVLQPKIINPFERGLEILFSGFPHGIPHLLIQSAVVAGLVSDRVFYIDGSVNGGNSGGPILDLSDGTVIGIVTQRRFLGSKNLADLRDAAEQIRIHCQAMVGRSSVQIMGIDFGGFSQLMAEGMLLIREVLEANANSGIGIGFSIDFVRDKCMSLGIQ